MKTALQSLLALALLLGGCATTTDILQTPLTRTERDTYTLLHRDTVWHTQYHNPPGQPHGSVLFPSSRQTEVRYTATVRDSVVERHYPNFIRAGLFESVGLIGVAPPSNGHTWGVFGLFPELLEHNVQRESALFTGGWYRFGIVEYRFPWFTQARDWSVGTVGLEVFALEHSGPSLAGILPLYLRKRWYLRDTPPYVAAAAGLGMSLLPSQYLNLTASLESGSLGGVNLRAYGGFLWGQSPAGQQELPQRSYAKPYLGAGISLIDFLNREEELEQEWSQHRHSSWSVGLAQFAFLKTSASRSVWTDTASPLISGLIWRLLPVQLAIPVSPAGFYAGTALASILILGLDAGGVGILPLRFGYWRELVPIGLYGDVSAEVFYHPSKALHLSGRLLLRISDIVNLFATAGFADGSALRARDWWDILQQATRFSGWYIGIGTGVGERLFRQADLWYYRR